MHPILFDYGGIKIYSYGFMAALAVVLALWISEKRAKRYGLDWAMVADMIFVLFISGIVGARILYVGLHWEAYRGNLLSIFHLQEGGLVWYGGFFSALFFGIFYARWRHWPILKLADLLSPVVAFAHGLGRIGCFLNGCCYGLRTDSGRYPTQLIESLGLFLISGVLFYFSKPGGRQGRVLWMYIFLYAMLRFCVEFLRGDNPHFYTLTLSQWMSVGLWGGCVFIFFFQKRVSQ